MDDWWCITASEAAEATDREQSPLATTGQSSVEAGVCGGRQHENFCIAVIEALARELDRWLADDELRNAAAERTRPFVWQRYDWRQIALRWKDHYARVIGAKK